MRISYRMDYKATTTKCLGGSALCLASFVLLASTALRDARGQSVFSCAARTSGPASPLKAASRYMEPLGKAKAAYGFDLVASPTSFANGACSSDKPFFFSVAVPDGNYRVSVTLGSGAASVVTVRAESRRLFVDRRAIPAGGSSTVVFNVNVRWPEIPGAGAVPAGSPPAGSTTPESTTTPASLPSAPVSVRLKPREIGVLDWDHKLTLEFNGENPGFRSISITPIHEVKTVYLAGDSTVVDQDKEPWAAWGQMLPAFFGPEVSVANEAESGETIRSFTSERRFDKILSTIRPGDYLLIQFAHNDQKLGTPEETRFKAYLARYVELAGERGASTILVTSMNRRNFNPDGTIKDTMGGYPQAMREFATERKLPLLDLNALSKTLFEAMGPDGTLKAFVHFPANTFPGQDTELKDDTHFTAYGAYELARTLVQEMKRQQLPLATYLRKDIPPFDAAHPDPVSNFALPLSPLFSAEKPYGK